MNEEWPKIEESTAQTLPVAEEPEPSWLSRYWGFWLVVAFIVYETTSQPGLATLIACIKVGWDEFSMAGWLLRVDPDKRNVFPKMALYIGYGLWKIAIAACLVLIGVVMILRTVQPGQGAPLFLFLVTLRAVMLALLLGFGLSTFFTLLAFFMAFFGGSRLYAGHAVSAARTGHYWPPVSVTPGYWGLNLGNFSRWLLISAFFMVYGIVGAVAAKRIADADPNNKARRETKAMLFLSTLGLTCMGGYLYLNWKVAAAKPEDCWELPEWAKPDPPAEESDPLIALPESA